MIGTVLSSLAVVILAIEFLISSQFWSLAIHQGLESKYAFLYFEDFNTAVNNFHSEIMALLPIIFLLCAIYLALYLFLSDKPEFMQTAYKGITSIIIFFLSELFLNKLSFLVQYGSSFLLSLSPHWAFYFSESYMLSNIHYFSSGSNSVMEIILDGIYVSSSISVLFFLMVRVAILIVLYLVLPLITPLYFIGHLKGYVFRFWTLYLQLLFSPIIILFVLYLYINFTGNFFIQMGFLLLLTILPSSFIYSAYRMGSGRSGLGTSFLMWSGMDVLSGGVGLGLRAGNRIRANSKEKLREVAPELHMGNILGLTNRGKEDYEQR